MSLTSQRPELDLLRRQVADLAREMAERDRLLHERTRHLHVAQALAHLGSWSWDIASDEVEWSDELYRIFGYAPQSREMTFNSFVSAVLQDDQDRILAAIDDALAGAAPCDMECRIVRPDGDVRTIHCCAEVLRDNNGRPVRMSGTALDVTDRKRAESDLQQREAHLRTLVEHSSDIITVLDSNGTIQFESPSFERLLGYAQHELDGRIAFEFVHPEDLPVVTERFQLLIQRPGTPQSAEFRFRHKDGSWCRLEAIGRATCDSEDRCCVVVNSRDITERKRTEEMLRTSQEKLRQALRASGTGLWDWNTETNQVVLSEEWKRQLGYEPTEIADAFETWTTLLHPEDREAAMAYVRDYVSRREGDYRQEFRLKHKDEGYRWIEARASFVTEADGRRIRLLGSHTDITKHKQMEVALRESEERYRTLYDATPSMYFTVDRTGIIRSVNRYGAGYLGYRVEDLVGAPVAAILLEEDRARVCAEMDAFFRHPEGVAQWEFRKVRQDGAVLWVREVARVLESRVGASVALIVCEDITERKRAEEALRLTQFSMDHAVEAILWVDATARIFNVNETACRMLGYARPDLTTMTVHDIDPKLPVERWAEHWAHLKEQRALTFEATYWSRDGRILETEVTVNYLQYDGKEYGCMILRDIGERKRAAAEVHRSHMFLRQVIDTDPHLLFAKDREGRFTMANKAVADRYGTTVENLIGKSDSEFNADVEEVRFIRQSDFEVMSSAQDRFIPEERIIDAGGRTHWLQTVKRPIFDDEGQVRMVLGAATDITERKRMEETLVQRERDLSAALQERERISQDLHDGILQSLYAVGLGLEAGRPVIKEPQDPVAEKFMATVDQAIGQLKHVMTEVRNFIAGLESQVMQGGDFTTALRTMVDAMSTSSSARCHVRIDKAAARRLSTEQAIHIINIVREGLSNALRHSRAKRITVSFRDLLRSDRLAVTDDGIGFDTNSVQGAGHGLVNMAARAQKVRGSFAIQSKLDKGTRISVDLPKDTHYGHY